MSATLPSLRTHRTVVPCIRGVSCEIRHSDIYTADHLPAPKIVVTAKFFLARSLTIYSRAASADAFRWAIASMVIIVLTPEAVGTDEPSITKILRASQVSPSGLVAEVFGELPSRAETHDVKRE